LPISLPSNLSYVVCNLFDTFCQSLFLPISLMLFAISVALFVNLYLSLPSLHDNCKLPACHLIALVEGTGLLLIQTWTIVLYVCSDSFSQTHQAFLRRLLLNLTEV
jgi:hypothetical protein